MYKEIFNSNDVPGGMSDLVILINQNGKYILSVEELVFFEEFGQLVDFYKELENKLDKFTESKGIVINDRKYCYDNFNPYDVEIVFDNTYWSVGLNIPEFDSLEELAIWFKGLVEVLGKEK